MNWGLISQKTPRHEKNISCEKSKESIKEVEGIEGVDKLVGGGAKKFGEFSPAQIQQAKDYIWMYLPGHTREIIVMEATTDVLSVNGLEIDEIILRTSYRR